MVGHERCVIVLFWSLECVPASPPKNDLVGGGCEGLL